MSVSISNREFMVNGDVIHVAPFGDFPGRIDGKTIVQRLDKDSLGSLVSDFNRRAKDKNFPGVLVDFDHFSEDPDKSSEAAGWITDVFTDGDGLKAKVRWTDAGKAAITNGRFRLLSPVWTGCEVREDGETVFVPAQLTSVALTNAPNIKGATPLSNRSAIFNRHVSRGITEDQTTQSVNRIAELAGREQKATGYALHVAYSRVMNRYKEAELSALDAADWSSKELLRMAVELGPRCGFTSNLTIVKNRNPRLVRMSNSEAGWDALSDLEPMAHAAYTQAVQGNGSVLANGDPIRKKFVDFISGLALSNPDIGYEGRYEKAKEQNPDLFWKFVASFEPASLLTSFQSADTKRRDDAQAERKSRKS